MAGRFLKLSLDLPYSEEAILIMLIVALSSSSRASHSRSSIKEKSFVKITGTTEWDHLLLLTLNSP